VKQRHKNVFGSQKKAVSEGADLTGTGRLFYAREAATGNALLIAESTILIYTI